MDDGGIARLGEASLGVGTADGNAGERDAIACVELGLGMGGWSGKAEDEKERGRDQQAPGSRGSARGGAGHGA
jgi:hypothetical protein